VRDLSDESLLFLPVGATTSIDSSSTPPQTVRGPLNVGVGVGDGAEVALVGGEGSGGTWTGGDGLGGSRGGSSAVSGTYSTPSGDCDCDCDCASDGDGEGVGVTVGAGSSRGVAAAVGAADATGASRCMVPIEEKTPKKLREMTEALGVQEARESSGGAGEGARSPSRCAADAECSRSLVD